MVELLSPADNHECLAATIKADADSIYFGVKKLNKRSLEAKNFDLKDLKKIAELCHKNKIKAYLTVNYY